MDSGITTIENVDHLEITENAQVIGTINSLLNKNVDSDLFISQLMPGNDYYDSQLTLPNPLEGSIQINEPSNNTMILEGEVMVVKFSGDAEISSVKVAFENTQTKGLEVKEVFTNSGEVSFDIKPEPLGLRNLMVLGFNADGKIISSSALDIFVSTEKAPTSLYLTGKRIFNLNDAESMVIEADFGAFESEINELDGIEFEFENGNFEHVSGSEIKAINIGSDIIRAKFMGVTSNPINVSVKEATVGTNNFEVLVKKSPLNIVKIYPNPSENDFIIELNSAKNQDIKLQVMDLNGKNVFLSRSKAVEGENLIQVNLPSLFPKGIYFVSIQGEQGIQTAKFIKQ